MHIYIATLDDGMLVGAQYACCCHRTRALYHTSTTPLIGVPYINCNRLLTYCYTCAHLLSHCELFGNAQAVFGSASSAVTKNLAMIQKLPSNLNLWVTEMAAYGAADLNFTWLEALAR